MKLFRGILSLIIIIPVVLMVYIFSLIIGKQRAIEFWGPMMTFTGKILLLSLIPKINSPSEFDLFSERLEANLWRWKLMYDISVAYKDDDIIKLNYANCPFCAAYKQVGLPEIIPYLCQGDWDFAKENVELWEFERNHQIATGDGYCDHTYKRKKS